MPLDWMDVSNLSFRTLLLLEREQLSWLPGWLDEEPLAVALHANPSVAWFMRHKNPRLAKWLDGLLGWTAPAVDTEETRRAEVHILRQITDLVVYAVDPAVYDALPFLGWDDRELTDLVTFAGKRVVDVGAGTGRLALLAAREAAVVWAVEPVENLRRFIVEKARVLGLAHVYAVDGLITSLPFPDDFLDVSMGGHVFGDRPQQELAELERVTRPGGTVVLLPGTSTPASDGEGGDPRHELLIDCGYRSAVFEEPGDGPKRKYWRTLPDEAP